MGEQGYTLDDLRRANPPARADRFRRAVERTILREFGPFDSRRDASNRAAAFQVARAYGADPDAPTRALIADGLLDDDPSSWPDLILSVELTLGVRAKERS